MNQQQHMQPPVCGPYASPMPAKQPEPVATLVLRVGRPNCGWLRRGLWEAKQLGRIGGYSESTGFLWRSFAITGTKDQCENAYRWVKGVMGEDMDGGD